jgi:hypothetical protein
MRDNVAIIYLQFTRDHEKSGLAHLEPLIERLFPGQPSHYVLVDNSEQKNTEIKLRANMDLISGDNSCREFSGYDRGIRWLESCGLLGNSTTVVVVNDTFHRNYGSDYLSDLTTERWNDAKKKGGILGYVDAFPSSVELQGLSFQKWIRSSLIVAGYPVLKPLLPFNIALSPAAVFRQDASPEFFVTDAPLSENYRQFIRTWLFENPAADSEFKENWHSKKTLSNESAQYLREKAQCILCEHYFSAKAQFLNIPLVPSNFRQLPEQFR